MKDQRAIGWAIAISSIVGLTAQANAQAACDVIVYRDANFAGPSEEITGDQSYVGNAWNDQISSIRVLSGVWDFYWDANYGGAVLRLGPGEHPFVGQQWNDQISSLRCVDGSDTYAVEGQQYEWYDDGWSGPGFYLLGYAFRRGEGFGGGEGWHGFHHHGGGGHGGGGHGGGGGHAGGGGHPGGGHPGGGHPRGGHPRGGHPGGGGHIRSAPHVTHTFRAGGGHPGGGHPRGGGHPGGGGHGKRK